MKYSLLNDICCPICHHKLQLQPSNTVEGEIIEGTLTCPQCHEDYAIRKRMPNLLPSHHVELHKLNEMDGWAKLWEKKGMYEHPTLEDSFKLPYLSGIWEYVSRMFDIALQEMKLSGDEVVLDIGAGQGWASRFFAAKGCHVIATDIVSDEYYGLGRSWAIMDHAGVYFEPLLGDGENLPFPDAKFDIVFFCGALHHFKDIARVLHEVYRVLKPGGRIIAAGEPSVAIFVKEVTAQNALEETQFGIVERRPKSYEYKGFLVRAGFKHVKVDTYETYKASATQIHDWARTVRANLVRVVRLQYKPVVWVAITAMMLLPPRMAARWVLYVNGGNLLLIGSKQAFPG